MDIVITGVKEVVASAVDADRTLLTGLRRAVSVAVGYGEDEARNRAPRRTSKLADSIRGYVVPGGQKSILGFVEAGVDYAEFVEDGTRPHVIEAKNVKFLRFQQGGAVRFARKVNHPGTKPDPFMANSVPVVESTLVSRTQEAVDAAIAKF